MLSRAWSTVGSQQAFYNAIELASLASIRLSPEHLDIPLARLIGLGASDFRGRRS